MPNQATADQTAGAAALRAAADFYERVLNESLDPNSDPRYCTAVRDIVMELRRRADETAAAKTQAVDSDPLLFWNEAAGVTYQDGRITLHVDQAVNLAQTVPAGSLILQLSATETLRKSLTRALTEAHAPRCPHCAESLADYDTDAYVYRAGDERPYCSSECVVAAYRAAEAPQGETSAR